MLEVPWIAATTATFAPPAVPVHVDPFWIEALTSGWARAFALVWGAIWGSFANVVIHRVPRGMSVVRPRSRCGQCGAPVAARDNIPVLSYLWLRGRCRGCGEPYGVRYVVVELVAAALSLSLYAHDVIVPLMQGQGVGVATYALHFLFAWALLVVTYIDLDVWIIPDAVVLPVAAVAVVAGAFVPDVLGRPLLPALAAGAAAYGAFAAIRWFYLRLRGIEGLGLGDAKLLFMVSVYLGPAGLLWTIGAGALQGLAISVPLLLSGREVANTRLAEVHGDDPELGEEDPDAGVAGRRVPFGPFLALAALEFLFFEAPILAVAARWLGLPPPG